MQVKQCEHLAKLSVVRVGDVSVSLTQAGILVACLSVFYGGWWLDHAKPCT